MLQTLAVIWPLAVGSALSPSITAIVLGLVAKDPSNRRRAVWFWFGAMAAMAVWVVIVSSFVWSIVLNATHQFESYEHVIDIVLGVALIGVGVIRLIHKPHPDKSGKSKHGLGDLDGGSYRRQFAFGAVMQGRNVTSIILFCAAQQHIDGSSIPLWQKLVLTAGLIGVTTSSIWLVVALPEKALQAMSDWAEPTYGWLGRNAKTIEVTAAFGFGAYLLVRSIFAVAFTSL